MRSWCGDFSEAEESCGERLPIPHGRLSGRDLTAWATAKDTGSGSAWGAVPLISTGSEQIPPAMAISAKTKMTAKVLMVAKSRAIEARSVKHRGEKRRFCFGRPRCVLAGKAVRTPAAAENESWDSAGGKDWMLQCVWCCPRRQVALGWRLVGGSKHEGDVTAVAVGRAGARASHDRLYRSAARCYQAGRHPMGLGLKLKWQVPVQPAGHGRARMTINCDQCSKPAPRPTRSHKS